MAEKEWLIKIPDKEFFDIPKKYRVKAIAYYNDYNELKEDTTFIHLYKKYKKAKKELEEYKFKKRNG